MCKNAGMTLHFAEVSGARHREGEKEYEEKICGNNVNRNDDCIFSRMRQQWKRQR